MRYQVSHGFNATDTDIYAYDLIVRFLAVRQSYPYAREDFIFLRRHECPPFYSLVRTCSPVRSSLFNWTYLPKWSSRWVHVSYTIQGLYLLPLRCYRYKKRDWHYFLFDLCYFVTILNFAFFWIFPSSPTLFIACYCLSHGSLASAVITWRNSLVFHDQDKVTSLFIHIYPPFSFTVIRYA